MNRLPIAKRAQILSMLCEGMAMRSAARLAGVSLNTVAKLLVDAGEACALIHDEHVRGVQSRRIQADEIWSFNYCKQRNVTDEIREKNPNAGDCWTWTALDADSKLIVSWHVGGRTTSDAHDFIADLAQRVSGRVQISTDGLSHYPPAVVAAFGEDVDLGQVIKIFGKSHNPNRYSPAPCVGCTTIPVLGNPDDAHISTSYVERSNLSIRMGMRRYTRLTNGFSKKHENHVSMVAIYTVWYNFMKSHKTLGGKTPAMHAGLSDHKWSFEKIVEMMDQAALVPATQPK
jgi:IS1 family transposase